MNDSGDIPLTHSNTPDTRPCGITSIIPNLGMSSCRGRAEAFARSLSSKLRTLGSQSSEDGNAEDEPIINGTSGSSRGGDGVVGNTNNTWVTSHQSDQTVTDLQPLRHETDSFFDFDCELESPGSPVDECEYLRLIETTSNTPHNSTTESGYACASAASSQSSNDGPYFDATSTTGTGTGTGTGTSTGTSTGSGTITNVDHLLVTTQQPKRNNKLPASELPLYVQALKVNGSHERLTNGLDEEQHEEAVLSDKAKVTPPQQLIEEEAKVPANCENEIIRTTQSLPTTGPDELLASDDSGTASGSVSLQDQILSELQKESEKYGSANDVSVMAETSANGSVITISNGHDEHGEDLLQIELTEPTETTQSTDVADYVAGKRRLSVDIAPTQLEQAKQDVEEQQEKNNNKKQNNNNNHAIDTTDDEDDCRPQRVRRCSSLKTGKTPPGTPGRKKIVRFADVLGLDLADVKTFLDEIPNIPKSAFEDLEILDTEQPIQLGPKPEKLLMPLFQQPGGLPTFLDMVREKQVSLENAAVTDNINQTINGSVRVRNLDFHKSVHIRYTLDGWRSFADLQANYVENSCDGFSDKFTFVIFGNSLHVGQRLEFAVRFQCKGQQFWDSNYGTNYCFQCLPTSNHTTSSTSATSPISVQPNLPSHHANNMIGMMSPTAGDAWCSSFY